MCCPWRWLCTFHRFHREIQHWLPAFHSDYSNRFSIFCFSPPMSNTKVSLSKITNFLANKLNYLHCITLQSMACSATTMHSTQKVKTCYKFSIAISSIIRRLFARHPEWNSWNCLKFPISHSFPPLTFFLLPQLQGNRYAFVFSQLSPATHRRRVTGISRAEKGIDEERAWVDGEEK